MASSSPVQISGASQNSSRTGLVTNSGSGRSYGTVKESPNLSFLSSGTLSKYCINHSVEEGDTLQGLALKYNVTIQQIRRANNLWNTDSLHIRPVLKIPVTNYSNESSRSGSPQMSSQRRTSNKQLSPPSIEGGDYQKNSSNHNGHSLEEDEEVRSKSSSLTQSHSADGGGVKSIAGILNSADEQLILAKQFAEKLALRCAERAPPEGAYNRTADMKNHLASSSQRRSRSPSPFSSSSFSSQQGWGKRVKQSTEKDSETREKVESQLFEL